MGRAVILFDENTAATDELAIQLDTTATRYKQMRAELNATAVDIGKGFNPVIEQSLIALKAFQPVIKDILVPLIVTISFLLGKMGGALSDAGEAFKVLGVIIGGLKTIAEESFNFVILQMLKFDRAFADVIDSGKKKLGDFLSKIPGVEIDFGINDQGRIEALKKLDEEIAKREKRCVDFFGTPEEQPEFGPFIEDDEVQRLIEKNKELAAIRAEAREEEKLAREAANQEQIDRDAEIVEEKIELEGEEL